MRVRSGSPANRLPASGLTDAGNAGPSAIETPRRARDDADKSDDRDRQWGEGSAKSYFIPAVDIVVLDVLLNQYNVHVRDKEPSTFDSTDANMHRGWVIDSDPFAVNQVGHPYQGSMRHGFARSAGLNYWWALLYDFLGSAAWEVAGETSPPSLNDQITTSLGGSFFGEVLFRMASAVLGGGDGEPGGWRELGAAVVSPATGFNRLAFGNRFDGIYPDRDPAMFTQLGIGARHSARLKDVGDLSDLQRKAVIATAAMDYGLPGKSGYEYTRPFDYFHFEMALTSSSNAIPENVMVRGLLSGEAYKWGDRYRGIWGLYGSYDYISPELFSVSSVALSLGTTAQWWLAHSVALQGTALSGLGWTAVGTIADAEEDNEFSYGYSPQALLELRVLFSDRVMLELAGREYHIGSDFDTGLGNENILRGEASLTVRLWGHHALALQFVASRRDADFLDLSDVLQDVGALSVLYTYLSDKEFGAVDWRGR